MGVPFFGHVYHNSFNLSFSKHNKFTFMTNMCIHDHEFNITRGRALLYQLSYLVHIWEKRRDFGITVNL